MKKLFYTLVLLSSVLLSAQTKNDTDFASQLKNSFSGSTDCVNDFEKILAPAELQSLNSTLNGFEKKISL